MIAEPAARLEQRARQYRRRLGIEVMVRPGLVLLTDNIRRLTDEKDLLVMHSFADGRIARMFKLTAVDRVVRNSRCPVLVVRRAPGHTYQTVIAAVDFSETSRRAARIGSMLAGGARFELFHAVSVREEAKLRSAEVSTVALLAYRGHVLSVAGHRMHELMKAMALAEESATSVIGRGDPARQAVMRQKAVNAGLVVVGRTPQSALADFVAGSVAHHLLALGTSDVLVVPNAVSAHRAPATAGGKALLPSQGEPTM